MSANKLNYFEVTQTKIVKARNKSDAVALANGRRNLPGEVLGEQGATTRIPAVEARQIADSVSS